MRITLVLSFAALILAAAPEPQQGQLILDDPLQGGTSGARVGGAFQNGGWQVTGTDKLFYFLCLNASPERTS